MAKVITISNISWVFLYARHHAKYFTWINSFTTHKMPKGSYYYPHLTDEETEAKSYYECTQ